MMLSCIARALRVKGSLRVSYFLFSNKRSFYVTTAKLRAFQTQNKLLSVKQCSVCKNLGFAVLTRHVLTSIK